MIHVNRFLAFDYFMAAMLSITAPMFAAVAPDEHSPVIESVSWDFDHLVRLAHGSDLWPTTWVADDNVYGGWGDGGGFDGDSDYVGRVSLGFARIEGMPPRVKGKNVWGRTAGGYALHEATFPGKPVSMLAVDGKLYAWVSSFYNLHDRPNPKIPEYRLAVSFDSGASWRQSEWKITEAAGAVYLNSFLNFGRDYAGGPDRYVYMYGGIGGRAEVLLARVPRARIEDLAACEYFAGQRRGEPTWTTRPGEAVPVLRLPRPPRAQSILFSVVYNAPLGRYLATWSRDDTVGKFVLSDAPQPWGPWTTAAEYDNWGGFGDREALLWSLPTKWISPDGRMLWCVFSAGRLRPKDGLLDSFNLVKLSLRLNSDDARRSTGDRR